MRTLLRCLLPGLSLALAGCGDGAPATGSSPVSGARTLELQSPAPAGSGEPHLSADALGNVYLSWLEPRGEGVHALRFARLAPDGTQWSRPQTIVERDDLFVNWADFPSLLPTRSGRLVAHWLQKRGADNYAYDVRIAQSLDGGVTWSGSRVLHDDGAAAEHGFVSLWETPQGEVQAAWLDGRGTGAHLTHGEMQLGFSALSPDGVPGPTELIDTRTCDCCQTDAAWSADGPVLAYRDRSGEEVRDIRVLRRVQGRWLEPVQVHADGWRIDGCPVNGPAIAAQDRRVAVAWFTAAQDQARVNVAFSDDGAAHFGPALVVDEGAPLGRVDLVLDGEGHALVSWMERAENNTARVMLRRVHPDGTRSAPVEIAKSAASRASGFPRMVAASDAVILAWTEPGTPSRVRLSRVNPGP